MKFVLIILIVALIAKDSSYLNDPYVMRGIAQGMCLVVGIVGLLQSFSGRLVRTYGLFFLYILMLIFSALLSSRPMYIMVQVVSLSAVIFFSIAYFEQQRRRKIYNNTILLNTTLYAYLIVAVGSLIFSILLPNYAYEILYGGEIRFRGLFSKPAMMAAASGLLIGLVWFGHSSKFLKFFASVVAGICLLLTLSRTFWVSLFVAGALTMILYRPQYKKWAYLVLICGAFFAAVYGAIGGRFDTQKTGEIVRADSITNLSGRTALWERGINGMKGHWFFGYGFTNGSEGLGYSNIEDSREASRTTLHNGYMQSLMDSGVLGVAIYILVILISLRRIYIYDKKRQFPVMFYMIVFLSIANMGEGVIYSASVFHSILFWIVAVFAFSIKNDKDNEYKVLSQS